jgi:hypothetical protein
MCVFEWIAKWGQAEWGLAITGLMAALNATAWSVIGVRRYHQMLLRERDKDKGDLACAQAEAERLGLTPLHADYPSDTRLGVEPGDWRLKRPAAKLRIEREMSANA